MKSFIDDYTERVNEISIYFNFLEYIDKVETHKNIELIYAHSKFKVNRDLQKILRANTFMLLYNLLESTIRNSIQLLHDKIHDEKLKYDDISDKLKEIWINTRIKSMPVTENNLKKWMKNIIDDFSKYIEFDNTQDSINISGNLDYKNIVTIVNKFGFYGPIKNTEIELKQTFEKIKFERNKLAHGNKRFCQSGEIITIKELTLLKDIIISYLNDYTSNVANYINAKKYLK